ncbi:AAA family ATPase, partial [Yersinia bercovieri]
DTAGARVRMSIDTLPEALMEINAELAALAMEQQAIEQDLLLLPNIGSTRLLEIDKRRAELIVGQQQLTQQYEAEKRLTTLIIDARQDIANVAHLAELQAELNQIQGSAPLLSLDVDVRTVATVIADWTGVPLSSLLKDEQTDLLQLENHLATRVVGQDTALVEMAQRLRAAKTGLTSENGPLGVFLLVGPSGVGKTETALALADTLFGGEKSLITINMSEYQEAHTVSQLKGSPPG